MANIFMCDSMVLSTYTAILSVFLSVCHVLVQYPDECEVAKNTRFSDTNNGWEATSPST